MDSKVCVNCDNASVVNATDNRLVTESCGHVKCIQCLLKETSGCLACKRSKHSPNKNEEISKKTDQKSVISNPDLKEDRSDHGQSIEGHFEEYSNNTEQTLQVSVITDPDCMRNESEHTPQAEVRTDSLGSEFGLTVVDEAVQTDISERIDRNSGQNESNNGTLKLNTSHIVIFKDGDSKCYLCTLCDRKFTARSQVTYHAYCNGQKKPFECKDCNKSFATLAHYKYHRQSKHPTGSNQKYFSCSICSATFIQKSKLKRHHLKHTKEKMHHCPECDKWFNNRSALRKHALVHSGRQPYACAHCHRRFRDSSNLRKHVHNKHGADKSVCAGAEGQAARAAGGPGAAVRRQHACGRCPKAFHSRKDLRRHEDIHTEDKPFVCPIRDAKCKQPRFRRRDNYNRHLRNTHGLTHTHNGHGQNGTTENAIEKVPDEVKEKAKLEVLNPLPPLPEDVIQKHLYTDQTIDNEQPTIDKSTKELAIDNNTAKVKDRIEVPVINKPEERVIDKTEVPVLDKSYIIEANNARESVICKAAERKAPSPVPAYVHKLKIANSLSHKDVCLPPIDHRKLVELVTLYPHKEEPSRPLDVGPLCVKDVQTLKNILHDKPPPCVHWRKKRLATDADHE